MNSKQLLTLGYNYRHVIGVGKDEKKAFEHYMKAAELGSTAAMQHRTTDLGIVHGMCSVGTRYFPGNGVDQDYNKAFEYFKKSANMGNMVAMYNVANCYRNGIGTKRDIQSANYWFKKRRSLLKTNKSPGHINPELKRILDDDRFKLSWIDYNEVLSWNGEKEYLQLYIGHVDVALKVIHNSNENEQEFIQELKNYCEIGYENPSFLECYGVSRNDDGDYIIVMGIAPKGSLQQNLVEVSQLEWKDKLNILNGKVIDLESIHSQELVHRDLHSENVLQGDALQYAYITDLGLSKKEEKICGILP
ncbi:hypothetical protein C2G38_2263907 [Gigaspora rosea]|uniref:Protein kinase domain-containing protein n=1 Tax=Gigaspora rosea TaxID=44941 RepID=A0A397UNE0_9GLOM|nr:hypothetical protein C2G38_2263907 [Gigaspora rosea]